MPARTAHGGARSAVKPQDIRRDSRGGFATFATMPLAQASARLQSVIDLPILGT